MYEIVTEVASNLNKQDLTGGLTILPFTFTVNGESVTTGADLSPEDALEFYARMRKKQTITTSQINLTEFAKVFEELAASGRDVLYIGLSSGVSGTYRQAQLAAEEAAEKYPERKFLTVDSRNAGFAVGLLVHRAMDNRAAGMSIEENAADIEAQVPHTRGVFVVDDLIHLHRTGRVSGVVALAGSVLGIKPLLKGDDTGHIAITGKARGKKAALDKLASEMAEHILPEKQLVCISHADAPEDAQYLAEKIRSNPYVADLRVELHEPMTGSHLGPGAVALFYRADKR